MTWVCVATFYILLRILDNFMKNRGHIAVLVAISIFCLCAPTYAQEDGFSMPNVDQEPASSPSTAGEGTRSGYTIDPVKKSAESKGADKRDISPKKEEKKPEIKTPEFRPDQKSKAENNNNKESEAKKQEEGEDVLSFNLLYYMIQKFKFSDVIDE